MNTLLLTGYSGFDLGIFKDSDAKVAVIKRTIKNALLAYLDEGLSWLIFTGNMGFEYWGLQVAKELQKDYPFQISTIFDFETHGQKWNEANQARLAEFKNVDFVKYAFADYQNPSQFRSYNEFLIENSDGALVFYDEQKETRLHYLVDKMKDEPDYALNLLTFEDLQEVAEQMTEEINDALSDIDPYGF